MIIAGPGTGKTRTLTHRLAHLVVDHGAEPEQCLAITFTRRAAGEMVERLDHLLGSRAGRIPVMTFHSLGLTMLKEHGSRLGLPESFRVAGAADTRRLLEEALSISERKANRLLTRLSRRKREGPESAAELDGTDITREFEIYQQALRQEGMVDFDDLIVLPVQLLETHPDLVITYRSRYRWISVDEFQDVDRVQYGLIKQLAPADGNLCVIGDPDQAIYGFRGADVRCFQQFGDDFASTRTVSLTTNYRSTPAIVDASLDVIAPASLLEDRRLLARGEGPEHIDIHACATDKAEAEFVVHTIERMIGGSTFFSMDSGRVETDEGESHSFGDFAVLYRADSQAGLLVEAFHRSGMPFQKRSHGPLSEVPSVQAVMQAMEASHKDSPERRSVIERFDAVVTEIRDDHPEIEWYLTPLRALARPSGDDGSQFFSGVALGVDTDLWDPRAEAVSLLTLHAAKGLEFPVVFIVGCEDGILPLRWDGRDTDQPEERRLFFVGMTRARTRLVLTYAERRAWRGPVKTMEPSPFLQSIDEILKVLHQPRAAKKPKPEFKQLTFFDNG